jgi:Leucine-rich repeat (LRR) protein
MVSRFCSRLPVLLNIVVLLLSTTISDSINSNSDLNALLSFKSLITKDPMGALSSWDGDASNRSAPHFCRWNGVTCSSHQHGSHVTALRLRAFGLEGNISQSLGNLSHLQTLDLSNNNLEGDIPSSIGNLFALHFLNLSVNHLSGRERSSVHRPSFRTRNSEFPPQ